MTPTKTHADIEEVIGRLREAQNHVHKKQNWSAYSAIKESRSALYYVERELAYSSIRAARDWGCAARSPGGKTYIIDDILKNLAP